MKMCVRQHCILIIILYIALLMSSSSAVKHSSLKLHQRLRRYAVEGSFWGVRNITYRISRASSTISFSDQKKVFRKAFDTWEEHTDLTFNYVESGEVHIEIMFAKLFHGDGEPFDGPGKVLAHAYFPRYGGDLHFDDDEFWSLNNLGPGIDLYGVAVHEIGHALGLKHSHTPEAIMAPFYQTYTGDKLKLHEDDLSAVNRLYGPSGTANRLKIMKKQQPNACKFTSIDAITKLLNGSLYVFKGLYFWEVTLEDGIEHDRPKLIEDFWSTSGPLDAVMTNNAGVTYVFKNDLYFVFSRNGVLLNGYPKFIQKGLQDMPVSIDAAFIWHYDKQPYFIKRDKLWKYSRYGMPPEWPKPFSTLFRTRAPSKIDAAFQLNDNSSFIFSGKYYWKISSYRKMTVLDGYPRLIVDFWFNCDGKQHIDK